MDVYGTMCIYTRKRAEVWCTQVAVHVRREKIGRVFFSDEKVGKRRLGGTMLLCMGLVAVLQRGDKRVDWNIQFACCRCDSNGQWHSL